MLQSRMQCLAAAVLATGIFPAFRMISKGFLNTYVLNIFMFQEGNMTSPLSPKEHFEVMIFLMTKRKQKHTQKGRSNKKLHSHEITS